MKAEPIWLGLQFISEEYGSRSLSSHKVHDERDDSEDDKQVNQEAAYMQDEESAQP